MDIKLQNEKGRFKYRSAFLVIEDDKVLIEISNDYYHYAGGHIEIGESSSEGVLREAREELSVPVEVDSLFAIIENLYETTQELSFVYKVKPLETLPTEGRFETHEIDKGVPKSHTYEFIKISELDKYDIRPKKLTAALQEDHTRSNLVIINDER